MPEQRLSADGLYYWDGVQWVSTLSPDGRTRWNGTAWVPAGQGLGSSPYYQSPRALREPTSWTRPLQYAVAGWYAISALYTLSLPLWLSGPMAQAMNQSIQRQEQLNPTASPPPVEVTNFINSMMGGMLLAIGVVGFAFCVVIIVGALQRWTWLFYAVLVLLGLGVVSLPINLISATTGSSMMSTSGFTMPASITRIGLVFSLPSAALFVWMLVALAQRGPWAMRKVTG